MSDTPRTDAARDYTSPEKLDFLCCKLERELAEANEMIACIRVTNDEYGKRSEERLSELAEFKRQIEEGELITPQTIHSFLETTHDRWNPLYMADLVKFAAEQARKDAQ